MTTERQNPVEPEPQPGGEIVPLSSPAASIERTTGRLSGVDRRRVRAVRVPREQIAALVEALGDSGHPLHAVAVDELVAIGLPAVPALCEVLGADLPWLSLYRAAEAAGRIGDGRATGALIQALNHPNSNVRWSAVRALTQIGDVRALLVLRRVAQSDQGRTSWGESVAGAAQGALGEIRRRSVWGQALELVKTAVVAVLMILALVLAFSVVSTLRNELERFGRVIPGQAQLPTLIVPTAAPQPTTAAARPTTAPVIVVQPTREAILAPTAAIGATSAFTGTVIQDANVRPFPATDNQPIGRLSIGDEVFFLGRTAGGDWLLVSLGAQRGPGSRIDSPDGAGWVSQTLLSGPIGDLPVRDPGPSLAPTATTTP
jgi:hypothetical protein